MPIQPSPISAVPNFLSRPAMPVGLGGGPSQGLPPGSPSQGADLPGGPSGQREPDIVEKLVMIMMSNPQFFVPWMAGLGFQRLLEKSGKFAEKPHRSNEELAQGGMNVGNPGQTGMPDQAEMMRQLRPPAMGGQLGF